MIRLINIKLPLDYNSEMLTSAAAKILKIDKSKIKRIKLLREALDNTDKNNLYYKITAGVSLSSEDNEKHLAMIRKNKGASFIRENELITEKTESKCRPVIVGFGPAGIFAALILAEADANPIVLERGADVDTRLKSVKAFEKNGILSEESNIQFGEGGAGAYSDGKLKIGLVDERKFKILSEFVLAGAPENIMYREKPHVGSDLLRTVVKNLRKKIISLGGEIHFSSKVTEIKRENGKIFGVCYRSDNKNYEIKCDDVILAIGHSARDTFEYLYSSGVKMCQKGFGVGVRIEHPQSLINNIQYGSFAGHPRLGAANYKLVTHLPNGRSVYTFCMCPGGYVVAAASEKGRICTNGMSEAARNGDNANAAMLVSVTPDDFASDNPLAGIEYQRRIEETAFNAAGGNYFAPVQRLEDFINRRQTKALGEVKPTYLPGTTLAETDSFLPPYITDSLRMGLSDMFDWMPDYYFPDAILTGPETRTTSPVRILRTETLEAEGISGLYPCGEGAGYAGGIVSAANDGILCAMQILSKYKRQA